VVGISEVETIDGVSTTVYKTAKVATKLDIDAIDQKIEALPQSNNTYTKSEVDTAIAALPQSNNTYTKSEVDTAISTATSDVYTKSEVDTAISAATSDVYTKSEVDTAISTAQSEAITAAVEQTKAKYVAAEILDTTTSDTEFVITHGLSTTFVDVSVQVKNSADDTWTFDLVVVQVVDLNKVKITLASPSAGIRYVIHGYDAVATTNQTESINVL
jgi:hypothetical protein